MIILEVLSSVAIGARFLLEAIEDLDLLTVLAGQATLAIENARLVGRLQLAEEKLRGELNYLKGREERRFANIIGESVAMRELFRQFEKVIDTRATVCIEGETGTGKEVIASAIHHQGRRKEKLLVAQNCAQSRTISSNRNCSAISVVPSPAQITTKRNSSKSLTVARSSWTRLERCRYPSHPTGGGSRGSHRPQKGARSKIGSKRLNGDCSPSRCESTREKTKTAERSASPASDFTRNCRSTACDASSLR
jgi:hypothetical protein